MKTAILLFAAVATTTAFQVKTDAECKAYLCKYGYTVRLNCACPPSMADDARVLPSAKWQLDHRVKPSAAALQHCTTRQFAAALAAFQKSYGLAATGQCDSATMRSMSSPRCGVVDDFGANGGGENGQLRGKARGEREASHERGERTARVAAVGATGSDGGSPTDSTQPLPAVQASRQFDSSAYPLEAAGRPADDAASAAAAPAPLETVKSLRDLWRMAEDRHDTDGDPRSTAPASATESKVTGEGHRAGAKADGGAASGRRLRSLPTSAKSATAAPMIGRAKRSPTIGGGAATAWVNRTKPLRWRIVRYTGKLSVADQESTMEQAFRKWAAITPLCFVKDVSSDIRIVDVVIAFLEGAHAGDYRSFDGYGGEIAHSYPTQFTHFDSSEPWTVGSPGSSTGYYLLPAAMHEFGHLIGLSHSQNDKSVMHSLYSDRRSLSDEDMAAAAAIYGQCSGRFDAVTDVVFREDDVDDQGNVIFRRYYSTIFFRNANNWLYKNAIGRPMDGEPMAITSTFSGLPNALDALVQHTKRLIDGTYVDTLLALKGSHVYVYDYRGRRILRAATISSFFPSGSDTLPNNLDSGYFDPRDGNIYFFKDDRVYVYRYDPDGPHSCCESIRSIADAYPLARDDAAPSATASGSRSVAPYQRNVDAAYLSLSQRALYLFKDDQVWVTTEVSVGSPLSNSMRPLGLWNQRWKYICEADC